MGVRVLRERDRLLLKDPDRLFLKTSTGHSWERPSGYGTLAVHS
ncbi:hypothetical protein ACFZDJ_22930 [Streptomyces sp. NPDC007896]